MNECDLTAASYPSAFPNIGITVHYGTVPYVMAMGMACGVIVHIGKSERKCKSGRGISSSADWAN